MKHRWKELALLILVFLVLYPGAIAYFVHQVEQRSNRRASQIACLHYNGLAFAVNLFHGTVRDFILSARAARQREVKALTAKIPGAPPPSARAKKLVAADRIAIKSYNKLVGGIRTTEYEGGCKIPRDTVGNVQH